MIKAPPLLIFSDGAIASLDNHSQNRIQSYLTNHLKGLPTVLSVIRRLDLLPGYDKILVLKDVKEPILNNLPIYLTPCPPLHEWRGGIWISYFGLIPKVVETLIQERMGRMNRHM